MNYPLFLAEMATFFWWASRPDADLTAGLSTFRALTVRLGHDDEIPSSERTP